MSKKKHKKGSRSGGYDLRRWLARNAGWIAGGLALAGAAVVLVLILASGGSGENGVADISSTPDPRVGTATPAVKVSVDADDEGQQVNPRFVPNTVEGKAGEVLEIEISNAGTVAHNLRVSGLDKEYDTRDDFASAAATPGKEARLLLKIDDPGSYPFRCDFHPQQQTGTLVLR
jgi:plastocyanin